MSKGSGPNRARAVAARKIAEQRAAERRRKALFGALIAAVVLVAAVVLGVTVYQAQHKTPGTYAVPKGADKAGVTVGPASAKAKVDIYLDYLCPICKRFEAGAETTLAAATADGSAQIVYHPIAILDSRSSTEYSTRASAASGCAADAGRYVEFTKELYDHQPAEGSAGLSDDKLIELGKDAGATSSAFAQCVKDGKYKDWTTALTETASKAGVNGTPTVKVNGEQVENPTAKELSAAIKRAAGR
jgi:protein-disulfide isomerase